MANRKGKLPVRSERQSLQQATCWKVCDEGRTERVGKTSRWQSVGELGRRVWDRAAEHPGVASRRKRKDQSRPVRPHPQQLRSGREEEPQLRVERRGQVHQDDGPEN